MEEGKDLIRYFSIPCKPTKVNGGRTRNFPHHAPEKWAVYKAYNAQDVETERAVRKALEKYPLPESEWELYALDQIINDRGVRVDKLLVKQAMAVDSQFSEAAYQRAKELTGLENPGSVAQLKTWLADQNMPMESLAKKIVQEKAAQTDGIVKELLNLRLELSKTSVKKYERSPDAYAGMDAYTEPCNSTERIAPGAGRDVFCRCKTFRRTICPTLISPATSLSAATQNFWKCCTVQYRIRFPN
jgi:hypothetical protein